MEELKDLAPKASIEAVEFLQSIEPEELQLCLFVDSLVTISDTGRELGEFTITIQQATYHDEDCYLIHANSHGCIDDIPCGTSIMAYVSKRLETLEQHHHEYVKIKDHPLDRKSYMVREEDQLVVNKIVTEGQDEKRHAFTFPWSSVEGFISEASNLLILRILAKRKAVPENMVFLSFDTETNLCTSTFKELGSRNQTVGREVMEVFGIERAIHSEKDLPTMWHFFFLFDGHLASRVQIGSPVTMKLIQMPLLKEKEEEEQKPVFEKKPLIWEEDMHLYSKYLDRKEELKANHTTYVRHHPELKAIMADFLQFLLLRKPEDVFTFAADYFAPFSSQKHLETSFQMSNKANPLMKNN
ncbi:ciliogenesis-associated TTC17-interacting protein [Acipenser ruthenus]|uniref:ciliogenesis-associated TTC17-interacting protein n=1 Tax=Acipenser ruthenus TaxID=7906 RepID=UPI00145A9E10|nr:ciliogenesis-associated TTC17-interacting protein [Acipenser ruthenus]